jgi:hypothetical protein
MTSRISKLVLAAVLAASLPAAAAARDCDHRDGREEASSAPWRPGAPPPDGWRGGSWREREVRRIRAELQALEAERAVGHARFAWNPRRVQRYDRVYLERRSALERRWSELQPAWRQGVAWR